MTPAAVFDCMVFVQALANVNGPAYACYELVRSGRLHLVPHVNAPVADFPVRRVVGAHHFLADLTLPFGRVVHDYNKEAEPATALLKFLTGPAAVPVIRTKGMEPGTP